MYHSRRKAEISPEAYSIQLPKKYTAVMETEFATLTFWVMPARRIDKNYAYILTTVSVSFYFRIYFQLQERKH